MQERKLRIVKIDPVEAGLADFNLTTGNLKEFKKNSCKRLLLELQRDNLHEAKTIKRQNVNS